MPWLSIITAILTFFMAGGQKKENRTRALITAGLAGAGAYYVTHETEWGKRELGEFDGVATPSDNTPVTGPDGKPVVDSNGKPVQTASGLWDVLKSWGPKGTATVIGTTGAVTNTSFMETLSKWAPWLIGGFIALKLLKD